MMTASSEELKLKKTKMMSWRFHEFGHFSNLKMEEVEIPTPAEGEVLVRIDYAGINPADKFLVMGLYPGAGKPPFSVGRDGCGRIVDTVSNGRFAVGDRVVFTSTTVGIARDGTLAEYVAIPECEVAALPDWWSPEDGAAGTKVFLTGWQALSEAAKLAPGENVLVTGPSGGVGLATLALSRALGARTIAVERDPENFNRLLELGADFVFDTSDPDLVSRVRDLGGADVVTEVIGGESLARSLVMANSFGRICVIGAIGGIKCEIDPTEIIFKRLQIHGIQVSMCSEAESQQALEKVFAALKPGKTTLPIDRVFPFDQVPEAFAHMRGGSMGKVLIGPIGD